MCLVLLLFKLCTGRREGSALLGDLRSLSVLTKLGLAWFGWLGVVGLVWSRGKSLRTIGYLDLSPKVAQNSVEVTLRKYTYLSHLFFCNLIPL